MNLGVVKVAAVAAGAVLAYGIYRLAKCELLHCLSGPVHPA